jgi:hypothetical protein
MKLNEDEIAKLKFLETIDELETVIASIKPSWLHPAQRMILYYSKRKLKKIRSQLIIVPATDEGERIDELGGRLCTICGEPLVLAQPDCPDPQHH